MGQLTTIKTKEDFKELSREYKKNVQIYEEFRLHNQKKMRNCLISIRVDKGLSVRAFANIIGISPAYLSDIENGNRQISDSVIDKVNQIENN